MIVNGDLDVTGNIDMAGTTSLKIAALAKFYLDGGGDTYLVESASNTVNLYTNGAIAWTTNTTSFTLGSGLDITLLTTKKLNLNVGGTAYVYESATNVVDIYAASTNLFTIDGAASFVKVNAGIDFSIAATKKLYLDGGTNTYLYESAADTVGIYTNATLGLQVATTLVSIGSARDLAVAATKKIFLDGGGDTYLIETSANTAEIFTGGTRRCTIGSTGLTNVTITSPAMSGTWTGTPTFSGDVTFTGTTTTITATSPVLSLTGTSSGSGGPTISFYANSSTPADGDICGKLFFYGNNSAIAQYSYGYIECQAADVTAATEDGDMIFAVDVAGSSLDMLVLQAALGVVVSDTILPSTGNTYNLGTNSLDWNNIYSVNALNVTSDRRFKTEIKNIDLGLDLINDLTPVFYKWEKANKTEYYTKTINQRDGTTKDERRSKIIPKTESEKRFHAGFIAQDVEKVLKKHEVDFGVLCYDKEADKYTMRYDELLPIFAKAIQELSKKIDALEKKAKK